MIILKDHRDHSFEIKGIENIKFYLGEEYAGCKSSLEIENMLNKENAGIVGYYIECTLSHRLRRNRKC